MVACKKRGGGAKVSAAPPRTVLEHRTFLRTNGRKIRRSLKTLARGSRPRNVLYYRTDLNPPEGTAPRAPARAHVDERKGGVDRRSPRVDDARGGERGGGVETRPHGAAPQRSARDRLSAPLRAGLLSKAPTAAPRRPSPPCPSMQPTTEPDLGTAPARALHRRRRASPPLYGRSVTANVNSAFAGPSVFTLIGIDFTPNRSCHASSV